MAPRTKIRDDEMAFLGAFYGLVWLGMATQHSITCDLLFLIFITYRSNPDVQDRKEAALSFAHLA